MLFQQKSVFMFIIVLGFAISDVAPCMIEDDLIVMISFGRSCFALSDVNPCMIENDLIVMI